MTEEHKYSEKRHSLNDSMMTTKDTIDTSDSANTNNNQSNYSSLNDTSEIWTITPSQTAHLQALHQVIQMNNNEDNMSLQQRQQTSPRVQYPQQMADIPIKRDRSYIEDKEKPAVGSDEWHRQRRENHKHVERRRRETINEGINEIARIVPGCEKNKGSILNRAAVYIRQLKENEATTLEKWTLEKLLTDQAINELNRQVEMLKVELERVRQENGYLKSQVEMINADTKKLQPEDK